MADILSTAYEVIIGTGPDDPAPSFVMAQRFRTRERAMVAANVLLREIRDGDLELSIPSGSAVFLRAVATTVTTSATDFESAKPDIEAAKASVNLYLKLQSGTTVPFAAVPHAVLFKLYDEYGR